MRASDGKVYLIGAGPGAQDLMTLRGAKILAKADIVFCLDFNTLSRIDAQMRSWLLLVNAVENSLQHKNSLISNWWMLPKNIKR